ERVAVVPLDAWPDLERPLGLALPFPLGREPRVELAVRMARHQVVEDVERDADVIGRGAEVRIELGDVPALGDDQLTLRRRLGGRGSRKRSGERRGGAEGGRPLEWLASCDLDHNGLRRGLRGQSGKRHYIRLSEAVKGAR